MFIQPIHRVLVKRLYDETRLSDNRIDAGCIPIAAFRKLTFDEKLFIPAEADRIHRKLSRYEKKVTLLFDHLDELLRHCVTEGYIEFAPRGLGVTFQGTRFISWRYYPIAFWNTLGISDLVVAIVAAVITYFLTSS